MNKQNHLRAISSRKLLFCLLMIIVLAIIKTQLFAETTTSCDVSVDFRIYAQDANLQEAILTTMCAKLTDLLAGSHFALTSERNEGKGRLISIASIDGPQCLPEYIGSGECGSIILAIKDVATSWNVALAGTELFSNYSSNISDAHLSPEAKIYLDPIAFTVSKNSQQPIVLSAKTAAYEPNDR